MKNLFPPFWHNVLLTYGDNFVGWVLGCAIILFTYMHSKIWWPWQEKKTFLAFKWCDKKGNILCVITVFFQSPHTESWFSLILEIKVWELNVGEKRRKRLSKAHESQVLRIQKKLLSILCGPKMFLVLLNNWRGKGIHWTQRLRGKGAKIDLPHFMQPWTKLVELDLCAPRFHKTLKF